MGGALYERQRGSSDEQVPGILGKLVAVPTCLTGHFIIPDGVVEIGNYAFWGCRELNGVTIPDGLEHIGDCAFCYCRYLYKIDLPESLVTIGNYAFHGTALSKVYIPSSVAEIGVRAFSKDRLIEFTVSSDNRFYETDGGVLYGWQRDFSGEPIFGKPGYLIEVLPDITGSFAIPEGVVEIYAYAFEECKGVTEIIVPESVKSIGDGAFYKCEELSDVHLSEGLETIGDYAFYGCIKMTEIVIPRSVKRVGEGIMYGAAKNRKIIVSTDCILSPDLGSGTIIEYY